MPVLLGFDYGPRRVGLAASDPTGALASAIAVHRTPEDGSLLALVDRLIVERGVTALVVGLPLEESGREGPAAARARVFAALLARHTGLPVTLVDERYSTREAARWLRAGGATARRARARVDAAAAELILQQHLDTLRAGGRSPVGGGDGEET